MYLASGTGRKVVSYSRAPSQSATTRALGIVADILLTDLPYPRYCT